MTESQAAATPAVPGFAGLREDPVILLGMHHSGTSIFSEVLDSHGVFMHANWNHHESKLFTRDINNEMVMGGGAGWVRDPIMPVEEVLTHTAAVRDVLERKARKKFLRDGYDGVSPWGWKDPRTCVLLPLYLEIFPKARLVHIVRNEDDVAASLSARKKKGVGHITDRELWKRLHRQHVARARQYGEKHGDYYEFSYEEWCMDPAGITKPIFDHLQLPFTEELRDFLMAKIYRHRIGIAGDDNKAPGG